MAIKNIVDIIVGVGLIAKNIKEKYMHKLITYGVPTTFFALWGLNNFVQPAIYKSCVDDFMESAWAKQNPDFVSHGIKRQDDGGPELPVAYVTKGRQTFYWVDERKKLPFCVANEFEADPVPVPVPEVSPPQQLSRG